MTMDHQGAVETMAVERYLLGELGHAEREAFESHFFDCRACAAEVRETAAFVDNLKAVLREQPAVNSETSRAAGLWHRFIAPFRLDWAPTMAAAALVLACLAGYQRFVEIPMLRQTLAPRAAVTAIIDPAGVRAAGKTITVAAGEAYAIVPLSFDAPAGATAVRLDFFHGATPSANPVHSETVDLPAGAAGSTVLLAVPLPLASVGAGEFNATARVRYAAGDAWADSPASFQFRIEHR
jgi:hypothetical protein